MLVYAADRMSQRIVGRSRWQQRLENSALFDFTFQSIRIAGWKLDTTEEVDGDAAFHLCLLKDGPAANQCDVAQARLVSLLRHQHRRRRSRITQVRPPK